MAALLSALHLFALAIGLPAVWLRAVALSGEMDEAARKRAFTADNVWGLASLLWLSTGLYRAFGSVEKPSSFYLANGAFLLKMGLFLLVFALELWPMVTLIRWRIAAGAGKPIDTSSAPQMALLSRIEAGLLLVTLVTASYMARGVWMLSAPVLGGP